MTADGPSATPAVPPLIIGWTVPRDDPPRVIYSVDGAAVGEDAGGFDAVLEAIRHHGAGDVVLRTTRISGLGGESLHGTLPFRDRLPELRAALGERRLVYDFL